MIQSSLARTLFVLILMLIMSEAVFAQKKGGHYVGAGGGIATASQDDINAYITSLNTAGTKTLTSAYEGYVQYGYRFGTFGMHFRPTYLTQSVTGGGVTATVTGYTFIPMLRIFPMENKFMKFLMQVGAGYGYVSGRITNGNSAVSFTGSTFGAQAGLGAEFCISASHCIGVEGNLRYMPIYRNIVTDATGSMGGSMGVQLKTGELETTTNGISNNVITSLGGVVSSVSYTYYF